MRRNILICVALSIITLAAFWPVGGLGFIRYDDFGPRGYIVDNQHIQSGINLDSIGWAFTTTQASNWHPVTWLSHMLDIQLFGLHPAGHHWVNLGFHIANTLLLFIVLRQLTRAVWRSALVAALFGLHPLHVQSVAWISERKDLLCGFFTMLTLWSYARYAQGRSKVEGRGSNAESDGLALDARRWTLDYYFMALGFFALGLMSKPMLVTLPVILLLLDFWPLNRMSDFKFQISDLKRTFQDPAIRRLLGEKSPFVVLSVASCIVTVWAQGTSVVPLDYVSWEWRMENTVTAYVAYLGKLFWPENLAIFYPYVHIPVWEFAGSALLLIALSAFCIRRMIVQPWLLVGWLWYLVMLLPVIGLVQVSVQSMADRYMYLPSIGVFLMVAWGLGGIAARSRFWRIGLTLTAVAMLLACFVVTRQQLKFWRDSVSLFSRALAVTGENPMGDYFLANACQAAGDLDGAARNYGLVLRTAPDSEDIHYRLGRILLLQKKWLEAGEQMAEVLRLNPDNAIAHKFLGDTLTARGNFADANVEYSTAQQLRPGDPVITEARALLTRKVENQKMLDSLSESLKNRPTAELHGQMAAILTMQGKFREAVGHYNEALRLKPDAPDTLNNLAWLLAVCPEAQIRDGTRAVKLAEHACELTQYQVTPMVGTLAAAYAEAGRFDDAIMKAEKACSLAARPGEQADLLKRNRELLALYRAHQPYHEPAENIIPAGP